MSLPCVNYKKLSEIDETRCLDCDCHFDCFPMDEETKQLMGYSEPKQPCRQRVKVRQASLEVLFHWIKSKIEAVVWGLSTIEKEFLSEVILKLPNGEQSTVGAVITNLMSRDSLQSLPFFGESPPKKASLPPQVVDAEVNPSEEGV